MVEVWRGSTVEGMPSRAPWSSHACCSRAMRGSADWRSTARSTSSSARNRSVTVRSGTAWVPCAAATLGEVVEPLVGHRPRREPPAIGAALVDGPQVSLGVLGRAGRGGSSTRASIVELGWSEHPVDLGRPAECARRHLEVVQGTRRS